MKLSTLLIPAIATIVLVPGLFAADTSGTSATSTGSTNTGITNTGSTSTGTTNTGTTNTGSTNSGTTSTGSTNTGTTNTGSTSTSTTSTGSSSTGTTNTGTTNTGSTNTGYTCITSSGSQTDTILAQQAYLTEMTRLFTEKKTAYDVAMTLSGTARIDAIKAANLKFRTGQKAAIAKLNDAKRQNKFSRVCKKIEDRIDRHDNDDDRNGDNHRQNGKNTSKILEKNLKKLEKLIKKESHGRGHR